MKKFFAQIFTWWSGQTLGTRYHTWRHGAAVGEDAFGNLYYSGGTDSEGRTRRWVIYNGPADPTAIPPGWHGWLHHRTELSPADVTYDAHPWEKPHIANMTGSSKAYRPPGSILRPGSRPVVTGDYDAWSP